MTETWSDFEIDFDRLLGRGGMGSVYRARQKSLDRDVAVKVLDTSRAPTEDLEQAFLERFEVEAKALARLRDPRIITILAAGRNDGKCWYAMELIEGETVDDRLMRDGLFDEREAARIAAEVARALDAAGRQGIIHRDVKPGNVFLLKDGSVKLGDFGLARGPEFAPTRMTEMNAVAATPTYCSPEQGMGGECDFRSDLYSLGIVLFEMLTERPPFAGESAMETLFHHVNAEPPSMRALNPRVGAASEAVVRRCLEKEPSDRYASYGDLIEDLDAIASGRAVRHVKAAADVDPPPSARVVWGLASTAGLLLFAFITFGLWRQRGFLPDPVPPVAAGTSPRAMPDADPPDVDVPSTPLAPNPSTSDEPPDPTPTPSPAPVEPPAPPPDPRAVAREELKTLLDAGRGIEALELARREGLEPEPVDAARAEAEAARERGDGAAVLRFGRLVGDVRWIAEGEAAVALSAGREDEVLDRWIGTRAGARLVRRILEEHASRTWRTLPFDPPDRWQGAREKGRVDYTFEGGVLTLTDRRETSWVSREEVGADEAVEWSFRLEPSGKDAWAGFLLSEPSGPAEGQSHGRFLLAKAENGALRLGLERIDSTGTTVLASIRRDGTEHRVDVFRRGSRVFVLVDGELLFQDAPAAADRPPARVAVGAREAVVVVTRVRVAAK